MRTILRISGQLSCLAALALLALSACEQHAEGAAKSKEQPSIRLVPESFNPFMDRFLGDSIYQVQHIRFPLPGKLEREVDAETNLITKETYWKQAEWVAFQKVGKLDTYTYDTLYTNDTVHIRIFIPNSGILYTEHYTRIKGDWFLVFYQVPFQ